MGSTEGGEQPDGRKARVKPAVQWKVTPCPYYDFRRSSW